MASSGQNDPLLTLLDARTRYGVSPGTLRQAIRRGDVSASRGPRQRLLVAESELRRWLTERPARGGQRPVGDLEDWDRRALEVLQ